MDKPSRNRAIIEFFILAAFCWLLIASNHWLSFIDDEATIINDSVAPAQQILGTFWHGAGMHEHPPLFELIYHFWLRASGGAFDWLRVPSIVFYLIGLWLMAQFAEHLTDEEGARITLWVAVVWPYGFHYGRLAAWYSLCFLCVGWVTLAYLRLLQQASLGRRILFLAGAAALVWTNYLGWAILACVAFDYLWRNRENLARAAGPVIGTAFVLAAVYIPLWRAFFHELADAEVFTHSLAGRVLNGGYSLYVALVSESVAPWYKQIGIPAAVCVFVCVAIVVRYAPADARRLLVYSLVLIGAMSLAGIANARRLLPLGAWLIAPIAVTLPRAPKGFPRRLLFASLAGILCVGWIGIFERTYYAAPRFIEPWSSVAETAANRVHFGWNVISNSDVFFFYLTYALRAPEQDGKWRYEGTLTDRVTHPQIFEAGDWIEAGHPVAPEDYFVRGAPGPLESGPAWDAERWLHKNCQIEGEQLEIPDSFAALKGRFVPEAGGMPWRIRALEFACQAPGAGSRSR
jgi:Dolichyl-phosphate-mannose-protein mannosyltransferase